METALKLIETNEVKTKSLSIVEQSKAIKIVDSKSYEKAAYMWKALGLMLKEIDDKCDKNISLWHQGHKNAVAEKKEYYDPVDQERRIKKKEMDSYEQEQEQKRLAEQKRLEEDAKKLAEEQLLNDAIDAEKDGNTEIADAILQESVYVPPVVLPKTNFVPKISGGPSFRELWSAEVFDIKALCRSVADGKASTEFVMGLEKDKVTLKISCPALNKQATALKQTMSIAGVRVTSRRV